MDEKILRSKLKSANRIIGDIEKTSKDFFSRYNPAPIGAIIHDFDFYTSTKIALSMLNADTKFFLPRVFCYFDDVIGTEIELFNDFNDYKGLYCDLTRTSDIKKAVSSCVKEFGGIDILISNAGIFSLSANLENIDDKK